MKDAEHSMADMNPSYVVVANGMKFTLELFPRNLGKLCTKNQILVTASPVSPIDLEGYQLQENFITDIMEKLRDHPQIQGLDINLASAKRAPMQTLSINGPALDKKRPGQKELDALHLTLMEEINRAVGEAHLVVPDSVIPLDEGVPITTRLEWNPETRTTDPSWSSTIIRPRASA